MYFLGLIAILLIALAIFFSPIFAVILMALLLVALGAYKFFGPGTEPEHLPASETPAGAGPMMGKHEATERGMWGEKRPEDQGSGEDSA